MPTISDLTNEVYSGDIRVDALLKTSADWNYLLPARDTLYYTFDVSSQIITAAATPQTSSTPIAFNAQQKTAAASILTYVSSVTGIKFAEVSTELAADIHFADVDLTGSTTAGMEVSNYSYRDNFSSQLTSYVADAFVFLDNREFAASNGNTVAGTSGYQVLLHEIGHALGLGHPFENTYRLPASQDNTNNTVMSYTWAGANKSTFQSYDLLALTWIYGGDGLGGTYGYNSTLGPTLTTATIMGTSGNDTLTGSSGNDVIDGGDGRDTVLYNGARANFSVTLGVNGVTVTDNTRAEGTDVLKNIERIQFADKGIGFDTSGNAGEVYRLYQAAFNRAPDLGGLGDWIYGMDHGMSLLDVSTGFVSSPEFASVYGQNPNDSEIVTRFYQNVLHRAPEQAGFDYWMNQLQSGLQTRTQVLTGFSESPENQAQVIGVIQNGIEYNLHHV